jgi:hypothetical protein
MTSLKEQQRKRLAAYRAVAPLAVEPDDELGMVWWNALTEQDRIKWSRLAGTGRAKDAWEMFKAGGRDGASPPENLPQASRASHRS